MKFVSMTHCILGRACCLFYIFYYVFVWGKLASPLILSRRFFRFFVDDNDRDLIRFPWFENINNPGSKIVIYRFTRVVFALISNPFLLNATLQHHLSKYLSIADITFYIEKLRRDLYVDDSTNSFDEVHDFSKFQRHV